MTHEEIYRRDLVDAYIRRQLAEPERIAVEDHLFECDECFTEAESLHLFVEGVREAEQSGRLADAGLQVYAAGWFRPAFYSSLAATCVLAAGFAWMLLVEIPRVRQESEHPQAYATTGGVRANLPLLTLESSRGGGLGRITIPEDAPNVALWLDPGAGSAESYRVAIRSASGQLVDLVEDLRRNAHGALTVAIPSSYLPAGEYRASLDGVHEGAATLAVDYRFEVRR